MLCVPFELALGRLGRIGHHERPAFTERRCGRVQERKARARSERPGNGNRIRINRQSDRGEIQEVSLAHKPSGGV